MSRSIETRALDGEPSDAPIEQPAPLNGRASPAVRGFIRHLHSPRVAPETLRFATTFGLGIITLTLFGVLLLTGAALMLYYVPSPSAAYDSILDIDHVVSLGELVRATHRYAGHGMVLAGLLHLLRVALFAGYRHREVNWLIGLCLLGLLFVAAFTGYLLPWDQRSFWAVRVVGNMLDYLPLAGVLIRALLFGGPQIEASSLLRAYALHVAIAPLMMIVLVTYHVWRIRKDGGLSSSRGATRLLPSHPHLVLREAALVLVTCIAVLLVAIVLDAPLGGPADPLVPSNPEKAPWFFLGLQELVSYSAFVGGASLPTVIVLLLLLAPFVDTEPLGGAAGASVQRVDAKAGAAALAVLVLGTIAYLRWRGELADQMPSWALELINPAALLLMLLPITLAVVWLPSGSARRAFRTSLLVIACAFVFFTLLGAARGPDWQLFWPWQEWPNGF